MLRVLPLGAGDGGEASLLFSSCLGLCYFVGLPGLRVCRVCGFEGFPMFGASCVYSLCT
jgi:hypothetical protein